MFKNVLLSTSYPSKATKFHRQQIFLIIILFNVETVLTTLANDGLCQCGRSSLAEMRSIELRTLSKQTLRLKEEKKEVATGGYSSVSQSGPNNITNLNH
jgi:hypothetical protein